MLHTNTITAQYDYAQIGKQNRNRQVDVKTATTRHTANTKILSYEIGQ